MNKNLLLDGKTYISVSEASKKLNYTADYIGQLCRAGKIDARMIGRTWYVEWESLKHHKKSKQHRVRRTKEEIKLERELNSTNQNFISAEEEDCPPEEYLKEIDEAQNQESLIASVAPEVMREPVLNILPKEIFNLEKKTSSPVEEKEISGITISASIPTHEDWLPKLIKKNKESVVVSQPLIISKQQNRNLKFKYVSIVASVIFCFLAIGSWEVFSNTKFQRSLTPIAQRIENNASAFFATNGNQFATLASVETKTFTTQNMASIFLSLRNGINALASGVKSRINHYALRYMNSLGFIPASSTPDSLPINSNAPKQGLVVVPDDPNHDATVATIKNTFSDEVQIKEDQDPSSGVIIPKFKTTKDSAYTYVLIPIESP